MTSKKLKKTFTAAFLSGSILLQNFPALAAASDTTDWLKESPFRQDITTEKSTPTESVPSETETVSPETLSTFQTEAETEAPAASVHTARLICFGPTARTIFSLKYLTKTLPHPLKTLI